MQERQREVIRRRASPGGGIWDDPAPGEGGLATVSHGPYAERLPITNMSVADVRARFSDRFDIDPQSHAYVDGRPVTDETIIRTDQLLVFMRPAGEKGWRRS